MTYETFMRVFDDFVSQSQGQDDRKNGWSLNKLTLEWLIFIELHHWSIWNSRIRRIWDERCCIEETQFRLNHIWVYEQVANVWGVFKLILIRPKAARSVLKCKLCLLSPLDALTLTFILWDVIEIRPKYIHLTTVANRIPLRKKLLATDPSSHYCELVHK